MVDIFFMCVARISEYEILMCGCVSFGSAISGIAVYG